MQEICGLQVKGLQKCRPPNFQNDLTLGKLDLVGMAEVADFFLRTPTLTASNFAALSPTDPKFSALKDLNLLKRYVKYQETSYNFRLGFSLSNRPHFNSTYLLRVPFSSAIAVHPSRPEELSKQINFCLPSFTDNVFEILNDRLSIQERRNKRAHC